MKTATWCEALFVSDLQSSQRPTPRQAAEAVTRIIRTHGEHYCAAQVAQEFGDHPETAVIRMRWARQEAERAYATV